MDIRYETKYESHLTAEKVLELFEQAGISKPNWTTERMTRALQGSSVVISAWNGDRLVGFANAVSDFAWVAYLSQLAVDPSEQGRGIGKQLVERITHELGDEVTLVAHSADQATEFYHAVGFESYSNVFVKKRKR